MLLHKQKVEFARDNLKTNEDHIRRQVKNIDNLDRGETEIK